MEPFVFSLNRVYLLAFILFGSVVHTHWLLEKSAMLQSPWFVRNYDTNFV